MIENGTKFVFTVCLIGDSVLLDNLFSQITLLPGWIHPNGMLLPAALFQMWITLPTLTVIDV